MPVKAVIESLEDVAEPYRNDYKETTDPKTNKTVYILDVDGNTDMLPFVRTVKSEAAQRRQDLNAANERLKNFKAFEGLNAEEVIAKLDKYPELELAANGKFDESKLNELVETRVKTKLTPLERELNQLRTQSAEKDQILDQYKQRDIQRAISDAVMRAGKDVKILDSAIEDAVMLGERALQVDEDGNVTTKDGLTVRDWLTDLQGKRPHWWAPTSGGGARGANSLAAGGANPFSHDGWNLTEQGRILQADRSRAEKLAAMAGTTVGGKRPSQSKK